MSEYVERIFLHDFTEPIIIKTVLKNISQISFLIIHKEFYMKILFFSRPPPTFGYF